MWKICAMLSMRKYITLLWQRETVVGGKNCWTYFCLFQIWSRSVFCCQTFYLHYQDGVRCDRPCKTLRCETAKLTPLRGLMPRRRRRRRTSTIKRFRILFSSSNSLFFTSSFRSFFMWLFFSYFDIFSVPMISAYFSSPWQLGIIHQVGRIIPLDITSKCTS